MSNLLLLPEHIKKDIPGFEGRYYASTDGRIFSYSKQWYGGINGKSLLTRAGCEHRPHVCKGYLRVNFRIEKKLKHFFLHILIARTFIPNPLNKPQVNHKDGNKWNNNYSNLEWATVSENMLHAFRTGLKESMKGSHHGCSKLKEEEVVSIIASDEPQTTLAKKYSVSDATISNIKNNKNWTHLKTTP